jgi:hypothetical protein
VEEFIMYTVEMGPGAMIHYTPSFIKISSRIQKLIRGRGYTDTQTAR